MPAGDGTGPSGMGPMTGRGAGYCAGYDAPGYANPAPGRGLGMAWGGGRGAGWGRGVGWGGRGRRAYGRVRGRFGYAPVWGAPPPAYGPYSAPPTPDQETEFLKVQAKALQDELDAISQRITELEQEK